MGQVVATSLFEPITNGPEIVPGLIDTVLR
jgi:hypothetical protein